MTIIQNKEFNNFFEIKHPLLAHKLTLLRDKTTSKKSFRELVHEITLLMGYEVTQTFEIESVTIETPMETYQGKQIAGLKPVILPILRAGLGMVQAFLDLVPSAKVGHIGMYRDEETLQPMSYYFKIPENPENYHFILCDPMLATGGSCAEAVSRLKALGIKKITMVNILAAPEGVDTFSKAHPDVPIFCANLDRGLNAKGYIMPGLGDAGDRLFGTC